ncbi:prephenate dehydrogenase dimerization domain-containing protein [Bradyrhizobium sp. BR 10261]|uniref:prephenate dehydrogenase dimerization domain-containing protein n=1 Tax=Bradyrhizobium sp. BR 10261 TaxID=2749992 RepID=UPI001C653F8E|nr:prephenate dehydrogenase dimerization domain-containing protein [Bradyrhizobium sp. BR 10261]MBW7967152.1 prephenate dehydrogenase [Bradyrhizobium sp. BR 10261]
MEQSSVAARAVIVGANGGFGRLFRGLLSNVCAELAAFDVVEAPGCSIGDAERPDSFLSEALAAADLVILCLPDQVLRRAFSRICASIGPECLLVTIQSVMSDPAVVVQPQELFEFVSINPLFAPDLGLAGRTIVLVNRRGGARGDLFAKFLRGSGAQVCELESHEHDRLAAEIQALVHFSVLSVALALSKPTRDVQVAIDTPPSLVVKMLAARILCGHADTYWSIQRENQFSKEVRQAFLEAATVIDEAIQADDRDRFLALLSKASENLLPCAAHLAERCATMFRSMDA